MEFCVWLKGRHWLAGLELPLDARESVDAGLRHVEFVDAEIAAVERLIAQQALEATTAAVPSYGSGRPLTRW